MPAVAQQADPAGSALEARRISKTFAGNQVLHAVNLRVRRGSIHALVGANGSGKSTLVKIISGALAGDPGGSLRISGQQFAADQLSVALARAAGLQVVHQELGLFPDLSVLENLSIGRGFETGGAQIRWSAARRRAQQVLTRFELGIDVDRQVQHLRPAEQTLVAIARALQDQDGADSGVLVLDEPTASLPLPEVKLLLGRLRELAARGQSILFIGHRLDEVCELSDEVTVLRDGRRVEVDPIAVRTPERLASAIVGRATDRLGPRSVPVGGQIRLAVRGLHSGPLTNVSFDLRRGEILGVAGLLGSGRSRLLRCLAGDLPHAGEILIDGKTTTVGSVSAAIGHGLVLVPEDRARDAALPGLSVRENLSASDVRRFWRRGALNRRGERDAARRSIEEYGIRCRATEQAMNTLSGGNQQKVVVARTMRRRPRVLLLDEPSQGVDIGARSEIHRIVRAAAEGGASAIVVSSDFTELAELCDRIVVLRDGRTVAQLDGPRVDIDEINRHAYAPEGSQT